MEFFKTKIDKGEDVDIDKAIKAFDAGKKKKDVKSKDGLPTGRFSGNLINLTLPFVFRSFDGLEIKIAAFFYCHIFLIGWL